MKNLHMSASLNANQPTIIHQQAIRESKQLLRQIAQDDPSAIFRGLKKLAKADRQRLEYLKNHAEKWIGINKNNILKFLSI